jgi:hypothetical protein
MTDNDRAVLEGALRITNDLSDVLRAIAVAAKLVGEKLELLEAQLIELLSIEASACGAKERRAHEVVLTPKGRILAERERELLDLWVSSKERE